MLAHRIFSTSAVRIALSSKTSRLHMLFPSQCWGALARLSSRNRKLGLVSALYLCPWVQKRDIERPYCDSVHTCRIPATDAIDSFTEEGGLCGTKMGKRASTLRYRFIGNGTLSLPFKSSACGLSRYLSSHLRSGSILPLPFDIASGPIKIQSGCVRVGKKFIPSLNEDVTVLVIISSTLS